MTTATRYYPVVVFDLDGTLLRRTTVALLLAEHVGQAETIEELERAFVAGTISSRAIADASAASYAGRTMSEITSVLAAASWIDGIEETLRTLARTGSDVLLATITWRFAAELLRERHGFAAVSGAELHVADGVVAGSVSRYFDEHDKLRFVEEWCAQRGIGLAAVAAVGESRSDLPLFRAPAGRWPSTPLRKLVAPHPAPSTPQTCATSSRCSRAERRAPARSRRARTTDLRPRTSRTRRTPKRSGTATRARMALSAGL